MTDAPLDIPTFESGGLRLAPLDAAADAAGMFELWSDPDVCRHSGTVHDRDGRELPMPAADPSISDRIIEFWLDRAARGLGFRWSIRRAGDTRFIGAVGMNVLEPEPEVAYHVVRAAWGQGIGRRAVDAACHWAFEIGAAGVTATIEDANDRSVRLAVGLGFERTGSAEVDARGCVGAAVYRRRSPHA